MPNAKIPDYSSRLTKARSSNELAQVVESIRASIDSLPSPTTMCISLSSSDYTAIESGDLLKDREKRKTKTSPFDAEVDTSGLATPDQIKVDAKLVEEINSYVSDLRGARVVAMSQRFSSLKSTKPLVKAIDVAIEEATNKAKLFKQRMRTTGRDTSPKSLNSLTLATKKYLEEKALKDQDYAGIDVYRYAVPDKEAVTRGFIPKSAEGDGVLYQHFLHIKDLENEDGFTYNYFCIVITARANRGKLDYYITSIKNERVAGTFPVGEKLKSSAHLRNTLNALLTVDGFVGQFERMSLKESTDKLRNVTGISRTGRTRIKNVKGIRVQGDSIYVKLYPALSRNEKTQARDDVQALLGDFFRTNGRGKGVLQSKFVSGRSGDSYIQFTMTPKEVKQLSANKRKVDTLADSFNLTVAQKREFLKSILG